jgi:SAM-dependent methyltransferase
MGVQSMTEGRSSAENIGATECARYNAAWATGNYIPLVGIFYTRALTRQGYFGGCRNLLDVGCGSGVSVRYHREISGIEAYGIDFASPAVETWKKCGVDKFCSVASAEDIPFKDDTFDMVTCTDVLEHVPEENVPRVFAEMFRVGRNRFFFTVALEPAQEKMPHDGTEPHICLKPPEWWVEQAGKAGFRYPEPPYVTNILVMKARKPKCGSILTLPRTAIKRVHFVH